jgi:hypothetical protein
MTPVLLALLIQVNPVAFTTVASGSHSGLDEPRQAVVRVDEEWHALWKLHSPGQPAPSVDFQKEMVVGVFLGSRPTAGYVVHIVRITEEKGELRIEYRERRPAPGAIVAQVITMPFHLVRLPRRPGAVRFERVPDGGAR